MEKEEILDINKLAGGAIQEAINNISNYLSGKLKSIINITILN